MISPPSLKPGSEIRLVSTARKINKNELISAVEIIEKWGFKVSFGKNLFAEDRQFAGTDDQRLSDFQEAINDPNVEAVLCVRGGYGTVRIIDDIDFSLFAKSPKWIIGYSDITVLHSHINANLGIVTMHSSMPINFLTNTTQAVLSIKDCLIGEPLKYSFQNHPFNCKGKVEAEIVGGNLSILYGLTGTRSEIDTDGKILFIEDLDEYLYHVDRMMMHLKRAGKLQNLSAIVIGGMSDMRDNAVPFGQTAEEIILSAISEYKYPVCFGFPAGHIEDNRTIKLGLKAKLTINESMVSFEQ